jgi:serine/threonine protein kinase
MAFSLKNYTDLEKLGEGGQGKVYRAMQVSLKRRVVIKEMAVGTIESIDQVKWLEEEATAAASLEHDNIVRLYDFGYDNGRFYLVMEYIEGFDLAHLMALKKFPKELGLMVMLLALKGLNYAHKKNIIHCDFKPNNILVSKNGRVTVTDFGMVYPDTKSVSLTTHGTIFLTPAFMPPELAVEIEGQSKVKDLFSETALIATAATAAERIKKPDIRRDLWSTGVILYRILSGNFPFTGTGIPGLVDSILHVKEPPIEEAVPFLPADLAENIGLCLRKDKDNRLDRLDPLIESLEKLFLEMNILDCEKEIRGFFEDAGAALDRLDKTLSAYHVRKSLEYKKSGNTRKLAAHFHEAEKHGFAAKKEAGRVKTYLGLKQLMKSPVTLLMIALITIAAGTVAMKLFLPPGMAGHLLRKPATPVAVLPQDQPTAAVPQAATLPSAASDADSIGTDTSADQTGNKESDTASAKAADTGQAATAAAAGSAAVPKTPSGFLKVVITPDYAQIFADENLLQIEDTAAGTRLKTGTHYITALADGYEPYWSSLDIAADLTRTLTIDLTPVAESHGYLKINSSPWSTVYIDGVFRGTTQQTLTVAINQGEHFVKLRRNGYRAFSRSAVIAMGGVEKIDVALEPSGR